MIKNIVKKYRVLVNIAWTTEIIFDKLFLSKKRANDEFKRLAELYKNDKTKAIMFYKIN